jgi:hypothetical protein
MKTAINMRVSLMLKNSIEQVMEFKQKSMETHMRECGMRTSKMEWEIIVFLKEDIIQDIGRMG